MLLADGINVDGTYIFFILAAAASTLAGAGGVIAFLFRQLISSKDKEYALLLAQKDESTARRESTLKEAIASIESVKKSYGEIAMDAVQTSTAIANFYRQRDGQPPVIVAAPVIPESQSPSTKEQRETAAIGTLRAALASVKLICNLPPRPEPEKAEEPCPENK